MKRRKRFALVIGVAAVGVMALGAQTAAAATYNTRLTITGPEHALFHGHVTSGGGKKCEVGRQVTLFKQRPGADRKLGAVRSDRQASWGIRVPQAKTGWRVYTQVSPKVGDGFVCRADRSPIEVV
jgi:hypothetical protein